MTRAVVVLTALLVIVLCLLWTAQRPATPEPLTVYRESDDGIQPPDPRTACGHRDAYGSTIIFVESRPQDGVCMLCDELFPMLRVVPA